MCENRTIWVENTCQAFHNVLNFIEYKAINDISEQIKGKRLTEETVKEAIKLANLYQKKYHCLIE